MTERSESPISSLGDITRGAGFFVSGKVFETGVKFVFNLLLTTSIGAALYGIFAYADTIMRFCTTFTTAGSDQAVLRYLPEYARDERKRNRILGLAYLTSLGGSVLFALLLYQLAPYITSATIDNELLTRVIRIFVVLLPFVTLSRVVNNTFRALELIKYDVFVKRIAEPTVRLLAVSAALVIGASLIGIVASLIVAGLVVLGLAVTLLAARTDARPSLEIKRNEVTEFYNFSLPLTISGVGQVLYNKVDLFMVGIFLSASAVGIYNISVVLTSLLTLPLIGFNQLFPPIAARFYSTDERTKLELIYTIVTRWVLTVSLLLALVLIVYRKELLVLFGNEFSAGTGVLALFALGQLSRAAIGPSDYMLMISDNQYLILINKVSFGVLNVVLNYYLIQYLGLIGAAVATAGAFTLLNLTRVLEVWYLEGMTPYSRTLFKPLVAGGCAAAIMHFVSIYLSGILLLGVGSLVGIIVFTSAIVLLGIEKEDKDTAHELLAGFTIAGRELGE